LIFKHRAKLRLVVECEELEQPVYVDKDMWEKIVLNLLSNALKFTMHGEIRVTIKTVSSKCARQCLCLPPTASGTQLTPNFTTHS
jgi:signal transduction histidine kinase